MQNLIGKHYNYQNYDIINIFYEMLVRWVKYEHFNPPSLNYIDNFLSNPKFMVLLNNRANQYGT